MPPNFLRMPDGQVVPNPLALKPDSISTGFAQSDDLPPDVRAQWQGDIEGRVYYTRYQFLDGQVQIHFDAEASEALAKLNCPQVLDQALKQSVSGYQPAASPASETSPEREPAAADRDAQTCQNVATPTPALEAAI